MKVLLVDDDVDLLDILSYALRRAGYTVETAHDGAQALRKWQAERPDLVLLDLMLPGVSGLDVCRRIRQYARTPIIMLTERSSESDVINGLESGADDYVTKPFSVRQLLARMQAVLRRFESQRDQAVDRELRAGEVVLDLEGHRAFRGDRQISLTSKEFRLLQCLALHPGQVIPYSHLVEQAWGYGAVASPELLRSHIAHLRRKLGLPQQGPGSITARPGLGYCLAKS